jgi:hypothetical protein
LGYFGLVNHDVSRIRMQTLLVLSFASSKTKQDKCFPVNTLIPMSTKITHVVISVVFSNLSSTKVLDTQKLLISRSYAMK